MHKNKNQTGTSNPHDQIKGELLATFSVLKSTYELEGLELALLVHSALESHVMRHEGLEQWANFIARLADMSAETISEIDEILHEDRKEHGRFH